jgi:hypothetical protein
MSSRLLGACAVGLALIAAACTDATAPPVQSAAAAKVSTVENTVPEQVFGRVHGGGHIREAAWDISFAGQIRGTGTDRVYVTWADADRWLSRTPVGEWVIQFHSVPDPEFSGTTFKSTRFLDVTFTLRRAPTSRCVSGSAFTVEGSLDGEPGWVAWVVVADAGQKAEKDALDSFRVVLWRPGTHPDQGAIAFDTFLALTANATCLGAKKIDLASGNLKVDVSF